MFVDGNLPGSLVGIVYITLAVVRTTGWAEKEIFYHYLSTSLSFFWYKSSLLSFSNHIRMKKIANLQRDALIILSSHFTMRISTIKIDKSIKNIIKSP